MGIVMNIEDFLKNNKKRENISSEESLLLHKCENIILQAISYQRGKKTTGNIKCCDISQNNSCQGQISITIIDVPNEIRWECPLCHETGTIKNWRKSPLLISNIKQSLSQKAIQKKTIFLNENEFYEILNLAADFSELKELISLAQRHKDGFLISPDELNSMRLLELIALRCEILQNRSQALEKLKEEIKKYFKEKAPLPEPFLLFQT